MTSKLSCTNCPNTAEFAGTYVVCVKLHRLVGWWWWRDQAPDDCPRKEVEDDDKRPYWGENEYPDFMVQCLNRYIKEEGR